MTHLAPSRRNASLTLEPLEDRLAPSASNGLDRWYATAGSSEMHVTWNVALTTAGSYRFTTGSFDDWSVPTGATVTVRNEAGDVLTVGTLDSSGYAELGSLGTDDVTTNYSLVIDHFNVPTNAVVDDGYLRLERSTLLGLWDVTEVQHDSLFIADQVATHVSAGMKVIVDQKETIINSDQELASFFAPVLHFNNGEKFDGPVDVTGASLTTGNSYFQAAADAGQATTPGSTAQYLDLSAYASTNAPDRKMYAVLASNGTEIAISYYFHYPRSNWQEYGGRNTHEGDWEGATLFLRSGAQGWTPDRMAIAAHVSYPLLSTGGMIAQWHELTRSCQTPHLYVSLGGHATFAEYGGIPSPPEPYLGNGTTVTAPVEVLGRVPESGTPEWLRFTGNWGVRDLPGGSYLGGGDDGPLGPAFQSLALTITGSATSYGLRWLDPWAWSAGFGDFKPTPGRGNSVLVLDTSGSMDGEPLDHLKQSANQTIDQLNERDTFGLVRFDSTASSIITMTEVTPDGSIRTTARDAVNALSASGSTSIGAGLEQAAELFCTPGVAVGPNRSIILMTDGEENTAPYIAEVLSKIDPHIKINTIGFGSGANASALQDLSRQRGGSYLSAANGFELQRAYARLTGVTSGMQEIVNVNGTVRTGQTVSRQFTVDSGERLNVGLLWPGSDLDMTLIAPDGRRFTRSTTAAGVRSTGDSVSEFFSFDSPQAGTWTAEIAGVQTATSSEAYNFFARTGAGAVAELVIDTLDSKVGDRVVARVRFDGVPLTGGTVTGVLRPDNGTTPLTLEFFDDGLHNDGAAGDGVFGTEFRAEIIGTYTLEVTALVTTQDGTTLQRSPFASIVVDAAPAIPVLNADTSDALGGTRVSSLAVDTPVTDIAVTGQTGDATGVWQYSLDDGTTWLALGTPSESAATLLDSGDRIRFLPGADYTGGASLLYRSWNGTGGNAGDVVDLSASEATGTDTPFGAVVTTAIVLEGPVVLRGTQILATGTDLDDAFRFEAGSRNEVTLNGTVYTFGSLVQTVSFDGGAGTDTGVFVGGIGNDTTDLSPLFGQLLGTGYVVTWVHVESATSHGGGGIDTARLRDSSGNEVFQSNADYVYMQGVGYINWAVGFENAFGYGSAGGTDSAYLFDDYGNETFGANPSYAYLQGEDFIAWAVGFDAVYGYATSGNDTARLFDSRGNEVFQASADFAYLQGAGLITWAVGFDNAYGYSTGGDDRAYLFDSTGSDVFQSSTVYAYLEGYSFRNWAVGFRSVSALGGRGGYDEAYLFDTAGNDVFTARVGLASLTGSNFSFAVSGFDEVFAIGTSGLDSAFLYDSVGDDVFYGSGVTARLVRDSGETANASGFDGVHLYSLAGGLDLWSLQALGYVLERIGFWGEY